MIDSFNISHFGDAMFDPATEIDYFPDLGITFSDVPGDIDQDGDVNQADYDIWAENFGFKNGFAVGDPGTLILGDADQSGQINLIDFQIINQAALAAGNAITASLPSPEPSSAVLLLLASLLLAGVRRSRA
jgi:hypothetical protein